MRQLFSSTASPLLLLGLGVSLVACSVLEETPPAAVEDSSILLAEEGDPDAVQGIALGGDGDIAAGDLEAGSEGGLRDGAGTVAGTAGRGMIVYFDYDSTEVKARFSEIIQHAAAHLQNNPSGRMRLEGHTDERGTRAYNLALGERRAQSVRDMILEWGALAEQVDWVSYGEELPAVTGQGERVWKQNRRVEIILEE